MKILFRVVSLLGRMRSRIFQKLYFAKICSFAPTARLTRSAQVHNFSRDRLAIRIGEHSLVGGSLRLLSSHGKIKIGDWCHVGERTEIWAMDSVQIGNRVLISHGVTIVDSDVHPKDHVQRADDFRGIYLGFRNDSSISPNVSKSLPIVIEDDVWISFGVIILKGVRIGKRSIIGAGSIIAQDIPEDSVVIPTLPHSVKKIPRASV